MDTKAKARAATQTQTRVHTALLGATLMAIALLFIAGAALANGLPDPQSVAIPHH
ncbi:MAG: hypothetical protein AAF340_14000 [Pseudomonadota bacterium]